MKADEINGWIAQAGVKYVLRRKCVVSLASPLSNYLERGRVIYTGGYVLPGGVAGPGQAALPAALEHAAIEQAAFWFQNRDRLGLTRQWDYHGTYRHFGELDLLSPVRAVLKRHERWMG